tara:strand:- start:824 stop:1270 length:447 start_codon:yes stop_codon:yes gene_type:complete
MSKPTLIKGGIAIDDRGSVSFVNDFDFSSIKRFYQVKNFSRDTIRAFHGHLKEAKYAYVAKGSAILAVVKLTSTENPDKAQKVERFVLSDKSPTVLYIPEGYANGFKILEKDTLILFFSTTSLEESQGDDFRFPQDYWGKDIWEIENR